MFPRAKAAPRWLGQPPPALPGRRQPWPVHGYFWGWWLPWAIRLDPIPEDREFAPHTGIAFGAVAPPAATASAVAPPGCGLAVGWSGGGLGVVLGGLEVAWGWSEGCLGGISGAKTAKMVRVIRV